MIRYKLFSEFRNIELFGDSFTDAITRHPRLQRTDHIRAGGKIDGERIEVARVIGEVDTTNQRRGSQPFVAVCAELMDGRIEQIDASPEEVKFK
jgi:hypothetical protein